MSDIVKRFRALAKDYHQHRPHYLEAVDEIKQLRNIIAAEAGVREQLERSMAEAAIEIEHLRAENWQLKGALGYPVPGNIMEGDFKCGLCEAKTISLIEAEAEIERLREQLGTCRELRVLDAAKFVRATSKSRGGTP